MHSKSKPIFQARRVPFILAVCAWGTLLVTLANQSCAAEIENRVTTARVPGSSRVVKALTSTDGTIHVLFDGSDGSQYVTTRDGGVTFSPPISIVDKGARKPGLEFHGEDLAIGRSNRIFVAMSNNAWKLKLPEEEWGLYFATLTPGDEAFKPTTNLNRKPSEGFSLAANSDGSVSAAFLSGKLYAKYSKDDGQTFTANAELNPAWNPCDCCTTSLAYGADGRLALLYREETGNERDIHLVLWNQLDGSAPKRVRVSTTSWKIEGCPMTYFHISSTRSGYIAAWPTKGRVYFARLDKNGKLVAPGEIETPGSSGMRMGLVALEANDGTSLIAWKNKDTLGWQLYDAQGRSISAPGSVNNPGTGAGGVVLPNGKFVLFL